MAWRMGCMALMERVEYVLFRLEISFQSFVKSLEAIVNGSLANLLHSGDGKNCHSLCHERILIFHINAKIISCLLSVVHLIPIVSTRLFANFYLMFDFRKARDLTFLLPTP